MENQRLAFRHLLTDTISERNRRLQNVFGNLNMASPITSHGVYDAYGNQVNQIVKIFDALKIHNY